MKFSSTFTIYFFFLSFISFVFSCKTNNSHAAEEIIYYYPEKNVYYDSLKSNYYYSLNGGSTWDSMAFKAPGSGTVLGPGIPIKRSGNNVWVKNESHRKEYNGVPFNIINDYTISLAKADRINKLKAFVKNETGPAVMKKKNTVPEKGLKKFLHKIFGKKKKPDEENN